MPNKNSTNKPMFARTLFMVVVFATTPFFSLGAATNGEQSVSLSADTQKAIDEQRQQLEHIDAQIDQYKADINSKQTQNQNVAGQILTTEDIIAKVELEVARGELSLKLIENEITQTGQDIETQDAKLTETKAAMATLLRQLRKAQHAGVLTFILRANSLSDVMRKIQANRKLQTNSIKTVAELEHVKTDLLTKQQTLAAKQQEYSAVQNTLSTKRNDLARANLERSSLIDANNQAISDNEKEVSVKQKLRNQILNQIFKLQSENKNITFGDAYDYAHETGSKTGVRSAMIMAMVQQESNLGKNVGTGHYPDDLCSGQAEAFLRITTKLGLDPKTQRVSAAPTTYSGCGGAMGPGQFLPTTWESIESQVEGLAGEKPVSPWNLRHAFLAVGVKLQGLGATAYNHDAEYQAAGRYFAGGNWRNFTWYPDQVLAKADSFEEQIQKLEK